MVLEKASSEATGLRWMPRLSTMTIPDRSDFIPKPGGDDAFQIEETRDFDQFRRAMPKAPDRIVEALGRSVRDETAVYLTDPNSLLTPEGDGLVDDVLRQPDGSLVVACLTEMPGVTAHMWDWWFAWHSYASRRYRLWHPEDHFASAIAEDRRNVEPIRDRWVGNTSYVDELVGGEISRLAIHFIPPEEAGLDAALVDEAGVAICARISTRKERLAVGHLIHMVENTETGARMHSRFHMGDSASDMPGVGKVIDRIANTPAVRRKLLTDHFGQSLLFHCSQEMNHLAAVLPDIHAAFGHE